MAALIFDTSVLIELERGASVPTTDDDLAVATITVSELLVGVELADDAHRDRREATVRGLLERFEVLVFDAQTAEVHAQLRAHAHRVGARRSAYDLIIAATAARTGRTVVTTDLRAFADLPGVAWRAL